MCVLRDECYWSFLHSAIYKVLLLVWIVTWLCRGITEGFPIATTFLGFSPVHNLLHTLRWVWAESLAQRLHSRDFSPEWINMRVIEWYFLSNRLKGWRPFFTDFMTNFSDGSQGSLSPGIHSLCSLLPHCIRIGLCVQYNTEVIICPSKARL